MSRPPRFWAGGGRGRRGSYREVVNGSRKTLYSLFCTESTLENIRFRYFIRKTEKLAKNVSVKGDDVNIL